MKGNLQNQSLYEGDAQYNAFKTDWKHFTQTFRIRKERTWVQKVVDFFTGNRYAVETIEVNFLYSGDVEPDVVLSGLYLAKVEKIDKKIVDF